MYRTSVVPEVRPKLQPEGGSLLVDDVNDLKPTGMTLQSNPRNGLAKIQNIGELQHQVCWRGRSEGREGSECRQARGVSIPSLAVNGVRVPWAVPTALGIRNVSWHA